MLYHESDDVEPEVGKIPHNHLPYLLHLKTEKKFFFFYYANRHSKPPFHNSNKFLNIHPTIRIPNNDNFNGKENGGGGGGGEEEKEKERKKIRKEEGRNCYIFMVVTTIAANSIAVKEKKKWQKNCK